MENEAKMTRRTASKLITLGTSGFMIDPFTSHIQSKSMNTNIIPSSNEKIPVVGLGTWQTFDVGSSIAEREPLKAVLKILVEHGGSVIDSSPMYGRSEKVVGDLTYNSDFKDKLFEATKVWTTGKNAGIAEMNNSFDLMKVKQMDLMQIHNLVDWQTHLPVLEKWKDEQRIRYIGITHYHQGAYSEVERIMKSKKIDFLQINYNLATREAADRILPIAKDKGIAVIINQPYAGGSLFRLVKNKQLPEWAGEFGAESWGQYFLKFILANPAVTCVIPGTSKAKHMRDNVQAGYGKTPSVEHQKKMIELLTS